MNLEAIIKIKLKNKILIISCIVFHYPMLQQTKFHLANRSQKEWIKTCEQIWLKPIPNSGKIFALLSPGQ